MKKELILLLIMILSIFVFSEVMKKVEKSIPTFTRKDFILAQCTFKEGDIIGAEDIKESILNLKKTNLFGFVDIEAMKVDSGINVKVQNDSISRLCDYDTIEVNLITKEMLALLPLLGFSLSDPYFIILGVSWGNLWRIGHRIEFAVTFLQVREFAIEYTIPSMFSRKYNGILRVAINKKNRNLLEISEYHKTAHIGAGYSLDPKIVPLFIFGYDRVNFRDDSFSFSYMNNDSLEYDEFLYIEAKLTTDHRNDPYYPTKGFYSETSYRENLNWWGTPITNGIFAGEYKLFAPALCGVMAIRNKVILSSGNLAYYNKVEPENLENRAIPDSDIVAFNRYSGNLEWRYAMPFKYIVEYPIFGTISINFVTTIFTDWTITDSLMSDFAIFDFQSYKWGFGCGFLTYSEIFNAIGIEIGYSPSKGTTDILKNLKYNLLLLSWNF